MIHWLIIILGIVLLASSISNPFYRMFFEKISTNSFFLKLSIRILLFIFGIIFVIAGLYIESLP
tara:strand:- start:489 stop:680 length:192 start_codon:yes stop_codon:yes gene_type:complete